MDSAHFSLAGPKGRNQDSIVAPIEADGFTLMGVADGVGGHADGKFASETAVKAVAEFFRTLPSAPMQKIFECARDAILKAAVEYPLSKSMATTLSVVRLKDGSAEVGHVGDSRIYQLRNGGLVSRTEDQTEVAELVRRNVFTPEEALRYPRRNVLISSLSADSEFELFCSRFEVRPRDGLVACTDGLYNAMRKTELIELFRAADTVQDLVDTVAKTLTVRGTSDDATLVAMRL